MSVLYALTKENFANIDGVRIVGGGRTHIPVVSSIETSLCNRG
jgi:hypothetical protein